MKIDENGVSGLPKNYENPFLKQAIEEVQQNVVRKFVNSSGNDRKAVLNMVDGETGEVLRTQFVRQMQVDEDKFTKIYLDSFAAFFDLSKTAIRVFGYIMTAMRPAKDIFYMSLNDALKYTEYTTPRSIYKGLTELAKANIIARSSETNIWYINPLICFNGSRVTFVNEYVKQETEKQKKVENAKHLEESKLLQEKAQEFEQP